MNPIGPNGARMQGSHYFAGAGAVHSATRQVQRIQWNGPGAQAQMQQQSIHNQNNNFAKPRALSRQADAHIKIEVHRDIKIRNYLQAEKQENMNLMFYDFNGSSTFGAANTAQNFYKPGYTNDGGNGVLSGGVQCGEDSLVNKEDYRGEGDRVPTRERGYRSAN